MTDLPDYAGNRLVRPDHLLTFGDPRVMQFGLKLVF